MNTFVKTCAMTLWLGGAMLSHADTTYPTPQAVVDALATAVSQRDSDAFEALLGPDYRAFSAGQQSDPALARVRMARFEQAMKEFRSLTQESDDRYSLIVGAEGWPFPVPIVRSADGWRFDGAAGVEELRNRLVGANELNAIAALDAYTMAQRQYALSDHDGDGVLEYAQRVRSTPGTQDGLYWEVSDDEDGEISPLDTLIGLADAVLGERPADAPFLGYRFRVLFAQTEHAKAGAYDYRVNGHMVGGFAMIAWPADYGDTGVMTFIVNRDGIIYQRDFGEATEAAVQRIEKFDPDEAWTAVVDDPATTTQVAIE